VEKAFHGLFPRGQHPKTPGVFGVAVRRILRRQTLSTVCYPYPCTFPGRRMVMNGEQVVEPPVE
jgi:hypothetical protein